MTKRIFKITLVAFIIATMFSMVCYGADQDTDVRIRIRRPRKYNEQVDLRGYGSISLFDYNISEDAPIALLDENVDVLLDTYYDRRYYIIENINENIQEAVIGPYHVALSDYSYDDYNSAYEAAYSFTATYGVKFYPFYNGYGYFIYGGTYTDSAIAQNNANTLISNGVNCNVVNGQNKFVCVYNVYNNIVLMYENNVNLYFTSYNASLGCNAIIIDKEQYRGLMSFSCEPNKLISINRVLLNHYLYGVISNEIGYNCPTEAMKAQVLAARTYAVSSIRPNSSSGYDMEDNQNSQVYGGFKTESSRINEAVDATNGEMIYYDDKLITAFYHSTSGGRTENSENIWVTAVPYLRAVDDPFSNVSPHTEWTVSYTKQELIDKIREVDNTINDIYGVNITKVSENERVLECQIITDKGTITFEKEKVRQVFGYGFLKSSWFKIATDCGIYLISEFTYNMENPVVADNENNQGNDNDQDNDENNHDGSLIDENGEDNQQEQAVVNPDDQIYNLNGLNVISSTGTSVFSSNNASFISSSGVKNVSLSPKVYYFNGRGYGHGVGMSQYGAMEMANQGYTYIDILKHYYTGVEIK